MTGPADVPPGQEPGRRASDRFPAQGPPGGPGGSAWAAPPPGGPGGSAWAAPPPGGPGGSAWAAPPSGGPGASGDRPSERFPAAAPGGPGASGERRSSERFPAAAPGGPGGPGASGDRRSSERFPAVSPGGPVGPGASGERRSSERFPAVPPPSARPRSDRIALVRVGAYELMSELGRGSSGTVYLARQPGIERLFALKLLPLDLDPEGRARLEREAHVSSRIEHPGVVRAVATGTHEGRLYLVMDYVPGETLQDHLARRGGKLPWSEARDLIAAIAEALQAAHEAGVIHRDVKPANVLLDAHDGRPRVTDFGLARDAASVRSLTREGDVIGTPYYMSPEQVQGRRADARTDVYALGVILYELLTGERPFRAQDVAGLVEKILRHRPTPPRKLCPELPPALDAACLRAMAREPAQRFPSARELARALREVDTAAPPRAPRARGLLLPAGAGLLLALLPSLLAWPQRWSARGRADGAEAELERLGAERRALQADLTERQSRLRAEREALARDAEQGLTPAEQARLEQTQLEQEELIAWHLAPDGHQALLLDRLIEELRPLPGCAAHAAALLRNRGRYAEALDVIAAARAAGDADPDLDVVEFRTLVKLDRNADAQRALEALAAREPGAGPRGTLARAILGRLAEGELLPALHRAQAAAPRLSPLVLFEAMLLVQGGAWDQAAEAATRALALEPHSPDGHELRIAAALGAAQGRELRPQELDLVLRDARDWREVRPDAEAWLRCGEALVRAGHAIPALRELEECRRRAGQGQALVVYASLVWSAGALLRLGKPDSARDALAEVARRVREPEALAGLIEPLAQLLARVDPAGHRELRDALPADARAMLDRRNR